MSLMGKVGKTLGKGADAMTGGLMSRAGNWVGDKIFGGSEDKRQLEQQRKLMQQQIAGQKDMGKFNQQLQEDMYNKYNTPEAKVKQLKDAGLSASLMYGGQGAGGATAEAGSAGQVSGGANADSPSSKLMASTQAQQMMANIELTKAQTEKTKAESGKIGGVDTQLGEAQIANLTQGIENQKAVQRLTVVQEELNELQLAINESTFNDVINNVHFIAQQNYQAMKIAGYDEKVQGATIEQKIKLVNQELTNAVLTSGALQQGINKSKAEINKMSEDIAQAWKNLEQRGQEVNIRQFSEEVKANYPNVINVLGKEIDDGIQSFYNIFRKNRNFYKGVK